MSASQRRLGHVGLNCADNGETIVVMCQVRGTDINQLYCEGVSSLMYYCPWATLTWGVGSCKCKVCSQPGSWLHNHNTTQVGDHTWLALEGYVFWRHTQHEQHLWVECCTLALEIDCNEWSQWMQLTSVRQLRLNSAERSELCAYALTGAVALYIVNQWSVSRLAIYG